MESGNPVLALEPPKMRCFWSELYVIIALLGQILTFEKMNTEVWPYFS